MNMVFFLPEGPFADDVGVAIEQVVDGMDAQVGHADIIRIGVDKGDGEPPPPVLNDGSLFPGKPPPGFFSLVQTHQLLLTPHPLSLSP